MRTSLLAALFVTSTLVTQGLLGCGGTSGTDTPSSDETAGVASKTLGTTGGTIATTSGASIDFTSGALKSSTTVTITESATSPIPAHATAVGTPYVFGPEGSQFAVPVTLTLPFSAASLPAGKTGKDIAIYTAPVGSMAFTRLATTLVDSSHVSAQTLHFSVFVPVIDEVDAGVETDASVGGCADDTECPSGEVCQANVCVVAGGARDASVGGCADNTQCPSGDVCQGNVCIVAGGGRDASVGGCADDTQCPTGEVCEANVCVVSGGGVDASVGGCADDTQCPSGEVCQGNVCVVSGGGVDASFAQDAAVDADADADAEVCAEGLTLCGSVCVDTSSSNSNCGACSMVCESGSRCDQGRCAS